MPYRPLTSFAVIALASFLGAGALIGQQATKPEKPAKKATAAEIEALIDLLVFEEGKAKDGPVFSPGVVDDSTDYRKRYDVCQKAFKQLRELEDQALPHLVSHLKDERSSINFRNHYLGRSVGDACHWNIYFQLQDRPEDYSSYGWGRKGRDGANHKKPYWGESPFNEAGGVENWLEGNKALNYREKQIKCLR